MKCMIQQSSERRRKNARTVSCQQNEEDRISRLPDELCTYILSKLPTADAMKTSVLSTRWRYMWTSVTNLEFNFSQFPKFKGRNLAFIKFVNQALITHDGLDIQRFCLHLLTCRSRLSYAHFWICFAARHCVQELDLCMPRATLEKLPDVIFTCETLRFLKLNLPCNVLKLPTFVSLINLQTLHLVSMSFRDDNVMWDLLSSCPKLENLMISNCSMLGMKVLNICSYELQNLSITYCETISTCELKLSAPKLQSFRYCCPLPHKFSLENMHSLSNVDIDFNGLYFVNKDIDHARRTVKILHGLDNVRTLILSARCVQYLSAALDLSGNFSWKLHNVRHLDLTLWYHKSYIKVLTSLFKCCSAVEFLCVGVDMRSIRGTGEKHCRRSRTAVAKCPLLKLKTVMLRHLGGVNKLDLVRFLVKNAEVLEKIITVSKDGVIRERTVEWFKNGAHSCDQCQRTTQVDCKCQLCENQTDLGDSLVTAYD